MNFEERKRAVDWAENCEKLDSGKVKGWWLKDWDFRMKIKKKVSKTKQEKILKLEKIESDFEENGKCTNWEKWTLAKDEEKIERENKNEQKKLKLARKKREIWKFYKVKGSIDNQMPEGSVKLVNGLKLI